MILDLRILNELRGHFCGSVDSKRVRGPWEKAEDRPGLQDWEVSITTDDTERAQATGGSRPNGVS
jgi:hypothetical protein